MIKKVVLIFLSVLIFLPVSPAQSSKVSSLQKQQKEAQQKVATTNKKLKEAQKKAKKSLNELNVITAEIKAQRKTIGKLNNEIERLRREEKALTRKINLLEQDLQNKKQDYAKSMQSLYRKNSGYDLFVFLFSANSFSQTIRRVRYLKEFSSWRKHQAQLIMEQQDELNKKRKELQDLRADKNSTVKKHTAEQEKLKQKESKQRTVVNNAKKNEKALLKELERQKKEAAELNRQIEKLIAEEARKSNSKSEGAKSDAYGGYKMTKDEQELAASFAQNKGKLPMPLSGKYMIVGHFGKQQHQELKYVQVNNSGIVIKTVPGTVARSVFDGVVTKIFVLPGYNSSVIVRHGNYLTIYSNLKEVHVKTGDKVKTRQSIGKIYSDPEDDNTTLLHFQLWKETTKLNPELWLGE
ncbi:MAG: peptidoglycan DD-metalloendopeptidase family protein [Bacteroidales bacterium]|nr:peptidoglycan DD-metalloendopeptidase family protein [Bacteroidales bacterium]MBQ7820245.1 peptidoglycan DD-metalloendopeptidase family protein [Bacteroidales bacterium]